MWSYLFTAIVFIIVFSVLILIHELGHFVMAKRAGIKIEEFGLGLPPRIWGKKKGETIYSINWIPFGGFVRMFGEDSSDPKFLKSKRSFISQSVRARFLVIVAGVVMNFILAWFLIVVGFTVGMDPLLAPDDVLGAVESGVIQLEEGLKIKSVDPDGVAAEMGMKPDDTIISINDQFVSYDSIAAALEDPTGVYKVMRNDQVYTYEYFLKIENDEEDIIQKEKLGVEFYDYAAFPRVKVYGINERSDLSKAGLREGDIIITLNGLNIYDVAQYEQLTRGVTDFEYVIYRNGIKEEVIVELEKSREVIISRVLPGTPAERAGLKDGDVFVSVNGQEIGDSEDFITFIQEHRDESLLFLIDRDGEMTHSEMMPEDGMIGVLLSELMTYDDREGLSIYNVDLIASVLGIEKEQYPFYISTYKAFGEMVRLSKLTAEMFVASVVEIVRNRAVPDTVAGPVGIASMTHLFVQEGFIPMLRFVAILSLSLGVINILPIPALDGGRLVFLFLELLLGRKVNQKWESIIHIFGYVLILLLILAVTYNDILRLLM